ncbi:MAG: transglutaminase-like domain-containing protein [Fimbriimonadales bacterium]
METRSLTLALLLAPCALASTLGSISRKANSDHLSGSGNPEPRTLKTHFSFKATVPNSPAGTKSLDLWLPIPSDGPYQQVTNLEVQSPVPYRVTTESKFGNRMIYVHVKLESIEVAVSFDVERKEISLLESGGLKASARDRKMDLQPDAKVPTGGKYADLAKGVTGDKTATLDKVRAIFDHVVATMQYDYKKESPHLGEGDVAFVCDYKKGNCSDLHSYVISLARSEGIPAYIEYGFPLTGIPVPSPVPETGKIGGYHCWTWFYDDQKGWLPLDASDGRRWLDAGKPDVKDRLVGSLVLERAAVAFSKGRDLTLSPKQAGPPLNNFIYPYAEADGKVVEAKWELSYKMISPP